ncbi:hypothetical protein Peur_011290 [Populus x canadensis]
MCWMRFLQRWLQFFPLLMTMLMVDVDCVLAINLKANLLEFFNVQSSYSRGNIFSGSNS